MSERRPGDVRVRFDVISVLMRREPEITHLPDAF